MCYMENYCYLRVCVYVYVYVCMCMCMCCSSVFLSCVCLLWVVQIDVFVCLCIHCMWYGLYNIMYTLIYTTHTHTHTYLYVCSQDRFAGSLSAAQSRTYIHTHIHIRHTHTHTHTHTQIPVCLLSRSLCRVSLCSTVSNLFSKDNACCVLCILSKQPLTNVCNAASTSLTFTLNSRKSRSKLFLV
jgi:hypothetical protein